MRYIVVAALTSQTSGWLKASALQNMKFTFFTLLVSQSSCWLKARATWNVLSIVAELVSQAPIAALNVLI